MKSGIIPSELGSGVVKEVKVRQKHQWACRILAFVASICFGFPCGNKINNRITVRYTMIHTCEVCTAVKLELCPCEKGIEEFEMPTKLGQENFINSLIKATEIDFIFLFY